MSEIDCLLLLKGYFIPEGENVKIPVAIKVLIEGTSTNQTTELLDEARVMASVDHPCCIKIIAVCMATQMMLVTPLMPNGALLSYIRTHASNLGSKILINWCAQIAKVPITPSSCHALLILPCMPLSTNIVNSLYHWLHQNFLRDFPSSLY